MYAAAGSIRFDGMTLFGNGVRPDPSTFPVSGSYTVVPVPLKSPALIASVAMVGNTEADNRRVVLSQSAKKNSLFLQSLRRWFLRTGAAHFSADGSDRRCRNTGNRNKA